jgi:hypothetical protein
MVFQHFSNCLLFALSGLKLPQDDPMLPQVGPTWPQLAPTWLNLAPTWPAKSSQNPPKLVPESIKKGIKLPTNLWLDFSSALDTFFPKLASKLEGRGTQNH